MSGLIGVRARVREARERGQDRLQGHSNLQTVPFSLDIVHGNKKLNWCLILLHLPNALLLAGLQEREGQATDASRCGGGRRDSTESIVGCQEEFPDETRSDLDPEEQLAFCKLGCHVEVRGERGWSPAVCPSSDGSHRQSDSLQAKIKQLAWNREGMVFLSLSFCSFVHQIESADNCLGHGNACLALGRTGEIPRDPPEGLKQKAQAEGTVSRSESRVISPKQQRS